MAPRQSFSMMVLCALAFCWPDAAVGQTKPAVEKASARSGSGVKKNKSRHGTRRVKPKTVPVPTIVIRDNVFNLTVTPPSSGPGPETANPFLGRARLLDDGDRQLRLNAELNQELGALKAENQRLAGDLATLQTEKKETDRRLSWLEESTSYRTLGLGLGVAVPTGPNGASFLLTGDVGPLSAYWFAGRGLGATVNATANLWGILDLQPIGLGLFWQQHSNSPMTVADYPREWDLMVTCGFDVRLGRVFEQWWLKHLMFGFRAAWFLPLTLSTPAKIMEERYKIAAEQAKVILVQQVREAAKTALEEAAAAAERAALEQTEEARQAAEEASRLARELGLRAQSLPAVLGVSPEAADQPAGDPAETIRGGTDIIRGAYTRSLERPLLMFVIKWKF